jgi:hypothetical protein
MSVDSNNSSVILDTVYVREKIGVQEDSTSNIYSQTSRNPVTQAKNALCNILTECGTPMKLAFINKIHIHEHLSDTLHI